MGSVSEKKTTSFDDLPPELKLTIWDYLDRARDKSALVLTTRTHHALLDHRLYRWAVDNLSIDSSSLKPPILAQIAGRGTVGAMKKLITAGVNPFDPRILPLCIACRNGREAMVRLLLEEYNVDPNVWDADAFGYGGTSPLYDAVNRDDCGIASFLLAAGADPNFKPNSPCEYDILSHAIMSGHFKSAALLIDAGASVTRETYDNRAPLWFAVEKAHRGLVHKILDLMDTIPGADVNVGAPLVTACRRGVTGLVRKLLKHGADIEAVEPGREGWNALEVAVSHGRAEVLSVLFEHGVSTATAVSMVDSGAIHMAVSCDHRDVISVLMANGVPVNRPRPHGHPRGPHTMSPLECAVIYQYQGLAESLIQSGAAAYLSPREKPRILWRAFRPDNEDMLLLLIGSGTCEHTPTDKPWSIKPALHYAISLGMPDLVSLMLKNGADPNYRGADGNTALTAAVMAGDRRIVLALLGNGTDPETWTRPSNSDVLAGESPQAKSHMQLIDEVDTQGCTPLYLATSGGREDIVRILLARGSTAIHTHNNAGWSLIGLATLHKDHVTVKKTRPFIDILRLLNNPASAKIDRELVEGIGDNHRISGPRALW